VSKRSLPDERSGQVVARNRKARHEFAILDTWEAGLVLTGTEVKSIRAGKVSIKGAYGTLRNGEVWLEGMNVSPYERGGYVNHEPERPRKLLMHRQEIRRLIGALERKGLTLVPLDVHFSNGVAKVTVALARGKNVRDRREDVKRRTAEREARRAIGRRE
jgi:SsrA-binding protein